MMKTALATFMAAAITVSAAPALACYPEMISDTWVTRQAEYGPVAVGRVTRVRTLAQAECLRRAGDLPSPGAPGPLSDNCAHTLGTADVRIERMISGQARGIRRVAWGEHLQCRNTFMPRRGDRVVVFPGDAETSPLFGRLSGWAIGGAEASRSPRLAAALGITVARPPEAQ